MTKEEFDRKWNGIEFPDYLKGWEHTGCSLNYPILGYRCEHVEIAGKEYAISLSIEHNRYGERGGRLLRGIANVVASEGETRHDKETSLDLLDRYFTSVKKSAVQAGGGVEFK